MRDAFYILFMHDEERIVKGRLNDLENIMTNHTVLEDWFTPAREAMEKIRGLRNYPTLSNQMFILLNCVRQITASNTLRDY